MFRLQKFKSIIVAIIFITSFFILASIAIYRTSLLRNNGHLILGCEIYDLSFEKIKSFGEGECYFFKDGRLAKFLKENRELIFYSKELNRIDQRFTNVDDVMLQDDQDNLLYKKSEYGKTKEGLQINFEAIVMVSSKNFSQKIIKFNDLIQTNFKEVNPPSPRQGRGEKHIPFKMNTIRSIQRGYFSSNQDLKYIVWQSIGRKDVVIEVDSFFEKIVNFKVSKISNPISPQFLNRNKVLYAREDFEKNSYGDRFSEKVFKILIRDFYTRYKEYTFTVKPIAYNKYANVFARVLALKDDLFVIVDYLVPNMHWSEKQHLVDLSKMRLRLVSKKIGIISNKQIASNNKNVRVFNVIDFLASEYKNRELDGKH